MRDLFQPQPTIIRGVRSVVSFKTGSVAESHACCNDFWTVAIVAILLTSQCILETKDDKNIDFRIKNIKNMFFHFYKKH